MMHTKSAAKIALIWGSVFTVPAYVSARKRLHGGVADGTDEGTDISLGQGLLTQAAGVCNPTARLRSTTSKLYDYFGYSVAVDDNYMIVGAPRRNVRGKTDAGVAYIYQSDDGDGWSQIRMLKAEESIANDRFGWSTALSGYRALVGSAVASPTDRSGKVEIFVRDHSNDEWSREGILEIANGGSFGHYSFGMSVGIDGDAAIVGEPYGYIDGVPKGKAHLYFFDGRSWLPQELEADGVANGDRFGSSVAVRGDNAIVGAPSDYYGIDTGKGAAYVFVKNRADWVQERKLVASGGAYGDHFGYSTAIQGNVAIVGAPHRAGGGAVYSFIRRKGVWSQKSVVTSPDAHISQFGTSVALDGDTVIVGTHDDFILNGKAYVFGIDPYGTLTFNKKLVAPGAELYAQFGRSVVISNTTIVVGAPLDGGNQVGRVYTFNDCA